MKTPYLIFQPEVLEKNFNEFNDLCKKHFNNYKITYSVKTNSFLGVINTLAKLGSGFEIASLDEIKKIPKAFTVFNGPAKTEEELKQGIKKGFLINIDSKSELEKIAKILNNKTFEINLRISLKESKFGFDEKQIDDIIEYCKSSNIFLTGISFHPGTQVSFEEYKKLLDKFSIILYFLQKKDIHLNYIDIGGGFPDKIQLKNLNVSLEDYFVEIKKHLDKFEATIILEPGRALVSNAFSLITKVIAIKENFKKKFAILDAGINLLPKITNSIYKFSKVNLEKENKNQSSSEPVKPNSEYILAGPLLFSNDILGKFNGSLKEEDLIKVENVGAYCYNLSWEISYKKPKIFIQK